MLALSIKMQSIITYNIDVLVIHLFVFHTNNSFRYSTVACNFNIVLVYGITLNDTGIDNRFG